MAGEQFASLNPVLTPMSNALASYRVEHRRHFAHGYAEVRKYLWSRRIESIIRIQNDVIVLNMALTPRPAHTRVAVLGRERQEPEDIGRMFVMMPGSTFRLIAPTGRLRSVHCALSRRKFEELLNEPFDWDGNEMELSGPTSEMEWLLGRIHNELSRDQFGRDVAIETYANALCLELARRLRRGRPARPELHKGGLAAWRMQLLRERAYADAPAPGLEELAELCGMTVRQLSRAFKAETGKTIGRFVDEATMERAHRLLAAADRSIGEVAAHLGFANASSFAHAFRRATGMLPSQSRQR
jgi:AraC family transcriptional regulator